MVAAHKTGCDPGVDSGIGFPETHWSRYMNMRTLVVQAIQGNAACSSFLEYDFPPWESPVRKR